jgi:NDP-sugar pyrophosphorylase family protein
MAMLRDGALSCPPSTALTGMIVERPASRLCALSGDGNAPGIRVLNRPFVDYQLALLRRHGVGRVVQPSLAGATVPIADRGWVLVLAGDILTDADLSAMLRVHAERSPAATVMIGRAPSPPYGRRLDTDVETAIVHSGVYIVDASYLGPLLARRSTIGPSGLLAALRAEGLTCHGLYSAAYSRRIRTPAAYHAAHMDLLGSRVSVSLDPPGRATNGSWIGDDVRLGPDATIVPPSVLGAGAEIGAGARVGPRAVIGADSRLAANVSVTESVLGDAVVVGESAMLDGCVVGSGARIGPFSILAPGAVLAGGTVLRSRTLLPR